MQLLRFNELQTSHDNGDIQFPHNGHPLILSASFPGDCRFLFHYGDVSIRKEEDSALLISQQRDDAQEHTPLRFCVGVQVNIYKYIHHFLAIVRPSNWEIFEKPRIVCILYYNKNAWTEEYDRVFAKIVGGNFRIRIPAILLLIQTSSKL